MAHSPHAARRSPYLVAPERRRERAPWIVASIATAVIALLVAALVYASTTGAGPVFATPSLTPADDDEPAAEAPAENLTSTTSDGRAMVLDLPDGQPIGRVVMFADRGQDAATAVASGDAVALTRAGWAVAAFDGAGTDYGSPASQAVVGEVLAWTAAQVPASAPLVIATYGTGAATALAGIAVSGAQPTCWASSQPISDLAAAAAADPALEGEITAAWGRVPAAEELPRTYVGRLPAPTRYRVLAPAPSAAPSAREDAATLVRDLQDTGHDVTTVELGAARADVLSALQGCQA